MSARVEARAEPGEGRVLLPETIERGSLVHVRTLLSHPMHTGLFNTPEGEPIAAHFVEEVVVRYGDAVIARFRWTSGISRDPFVSFPIRADREAPLRVTWKDNLGGVFEASAEVRFS
jgi:sulfur-oxidizing protein SoxZ